ncbi:MAG TPA: CopG family antitoxin [Bacilli bacterium]
MKTIHSVQEIPTCMSEDEAAEFWATHTMSEELLEASVIEDDDDDLPVRTKSVSISLRLDADLLTRIRKLAKYKHKGYQTVIKDFLVERAYEEEKKYERGQEHVEV